MHDNFVSGKFMKGAFVQIKKVKTIPIPNVVLFQFNPETIEHTWEQPDVGDGGGKPGSYSNPQAASGTPGQSFSFTLQMDANDQVASAGQLNPSSRLSSTVVDAYAGVAHYSGVAARLAALELLLYPVNLIAKEQLVAPTNAKLACEIPQALLPTVLFVWGPARILPVRVTSLSVTEKLFDRLLLPTHVDVKIGLRVLKPEELNTLSKSSDPLARISNRAYDYSNAFRIAAAAANTINTVGDIGINFLF